jgi:2-polyprenyl-3-methyl-5-hydroxy-6-metoxy-1,4-benzoquinol methylase
MGPKIISRWRVAQFLERRWWRRYLGSRSPEKYLSDKRAYWERTLHTLGWEVVSGRRALEAGCGPAGVFISIHEREQVTALDPLLEAYEEDLAIFSRKNYPSVVFRVATLEAPPSTLGQFDAIYCFNAINHVADWPLSMDNLTAMAAPGAKMLLSSDVHRHKWLLPLFRALPGDVLHPQQHAAADYREALEQRGWGIDQEVVLRETTIFNFVVWVATKC